MAVVSTNIKIEQSLKQDAQALFESLGMNLSTAVNIFLRQAVREQGIPFTISAASPNAETIAAIEEIRKMKTDPSLGKTFSNVDEMMEDLLSDV